MADNKLAFILMLDSSGSMYPCLDMVKIDAKAFVRQGRVGDQFAINQFSDNASWVYPPGNDPTLITITDGLDETARALPYIDAIKSQNMTNMGEAIEFGNRIMDRSRITASLRAYVILSDGMHNVGVDPIEALRGEPPVYIAALGMVDRTYFDRLIKKNPKSRFYNQPHAYEMMMMFNQIVADANENELIINDMNPYNVGADYLLKDFTITANENCSQLNVVWSDKNYKYTPGYPGKYKINIVLIDPDDRNTDIKPDIAEDGYCIYNLENVKPGEWKLLIQYSTNEHITGTVGGVDFYTDIRTGLILPKSMKSDEPLSVRVSALKGNEIMDGTRVTAEISSPVLSEEEIRDQYASQIEMLMNRAMDDPEAGDEQNVMNRLRDEILKTEGKDISAKEFSTHQLVLSGDGEYVLADEKKLKSGIANVNVRVEGMDPRTNIRFTRLKAGSVLVSES